MLTILLPPNEYKAAIYQRLSRDEDGKQESNSITNQRRILTAYAAENGYEVYDEYVDDGWSGVNFERPSFKRMMADIEAGKVNMVIVKDLSRLGREYIATGQYIEKVFPSRNVRFIAIGDNYDSLFEDEPSADLMPMINYFNELHAKQTSRKVRASMQSMARAGKFLGSKPPYGYDRDPQDKYHLVVDPEAADAVRLIFQLACDGMGYKAICRQLRLHGVPNPNAYVNTKHPDHHKSEYWKEPHDWHATSIKTILNNPTYLGKVVNGRRGISSFKNKKVVQKPEESWIVTEGTHEAIIDQAAWDRAQKQLAVRKRCDNHGTVQIFAGLVRCADCGYALAFSQHQGKRYQCSQYNVKGKAYCSSHHITYEELYETVLYDIRRRARAAAGMDEVMLYNLKRDAAGALKGKLKQAEKTNAKLEKRVAELDTIIEKMFEDSALGHLTPDRFAILMRRYETEQNEVKEQLAAVRQELTELQKRQGESDIFIELIAKYKDIKKLNAPILNELISKIEVGAIQRDDSKKRRQIKITYRQFCYVELFSEGDIFGKWDEKMYQEWDSLENEMAKADAAEMQQLIDSGEPPSDTIKPTTECIIHNTL